MKKTAKKNYYLNKTHKRKQYYSIFGGMDPDPHLVPLKLGEKPFESLFKRDGKLTTKFINPEIGEGVYLKAILKLGLLLIKDNIDSVQLQGINQLIDKSEIHFSFIADRPTAERKDQGVPAGPIFPHVTITVQMGPKRVKHHYGYHPTIEKLKKPEYWNHGEKNSGSGWKSILWNEVIDKTTVVDDSDYVVDDSDYVVDDSNDVIDETTVVDDSNDVTDETTVVDDSNDVTDETTVVDDSTDVIDKTTVVDDSDDVVILLNLARCLMEEYEKTYFKELLPKEGIYIEELDIDVSKLLGNKSKNPDAIALNKINNKKATEAVKAQYETKNPVIFSPKVFETIGAKIGMTLQDASGIARANIASIIESDDYETIIANIKSKGVIKKFDIEAAIKKANSKPWVFHSSSSSARGSSSLSARGSSSLSARGSSSLAAASTRRDEDEETERGDRSRSPQRTVSMDQASSASTADPETPRGMAPGTPRAMDPETRIPRAPGWRPRGPPPPPPLPPPPPRAMDPEARIPRAPGWRPRGPPPPPPLPPPPPRAMDPEARIPRAPGWRPRGRPPGGGQPGGSLGNKKSRKSRKSRKSKKSKKSRKYKKSRKSRK